MQHGMTEKRSSDQLEVNLCKSLAAVLTLYINIHSASHTVTFSLQEAFSRTAVPATVTHTDMRNLEVQRLGAHSCADSWTTDTWAKTCPSTLPPGQVGNRYSSSSAGQCQRAALIHVNPWAIHRCCYDWWYWRTKAQTCLTYSYRT